MLAKCANDGCDARFLYLHEGALFSVGRGSGIPKPGLLNGFEHAGTFRRFRYFWLCPRCCETMALRVDGERVVAVRRERKQPSTAAMEACSERAA